AGAPHEADSQPRVDQIADEHAGGGAGDHSKQDEVARELEDADQEAREDDELGEIVEGEAEERVRVAGREPAGRLRPRHAGLRVPSSARRSSRAAALTRSASAWHHAIDPRWSRTSANASSSGGDQRAPRRSRTP